MPAACGKENCKCTDCKCGPSCGEKCGCESTGCQCGPEQSGCSGCQCQAAAGDQAEDTEAP